MNCLEKRVLNTERTKWDWRSLTKNPAISLQFIVDTIEDFPWDFTILTNEMPLDIINKYPNKKWDWRLVSIKAKSTDIFKYKNINWVWYVLSNRGDIVSNLLTDHPELPWDYAVLSANNLDIKKRNTEIGSAPIVQKPSLPPKESDKRPVPSAPDQPANNTTTPIAPMPPKATEENFIEYIGEL